MSKTRFFFPRNPIWRKFWNSDPTFFRRIPRIRVFDRKNSEFRVIWPVPPIGTIFLTMRIRISVVTIKFFLFDTHPNLAEYFFGGKVKGAVATNFSKKFFFKFHDLWELKRFSKFIQKNIKNEFSPKLFFNFPFIN